MAARIFCNICGVHLFDVNPDAPRTITGEEICTTCGDRTEAAFALLEDVAKRFQADLAECLQRAKEAFSSIDETYAEIRLEGEEMQAQMLEELKTLKANVVDQEMEEAA